MKFLAKLTKNPNIEYVTVDLSNDVSKSMIKQYLKALTLRHDTTDPNDFLLMYSYKINPRGEQIIYADVEVNDENLLLDNDYDEGTLQFPYMLDREAKAGNSIDECIDFLLNNILEDKNVLYVCIFHSQSVLDIGDIMDYKRWDLTILREDDIEFYKQEKLESDAFLNEFLAQ